MRVLILDNYDSFTFNLYQYVGEILSASGEKFTLDVVRNDEITLAEIEKRKYDRIIISPGPGDPRDPKYFGVCADVLIKIGKTTPVLGVCLGMQGMAYYFGGGVTRAQKPMHGKTSIIEHDGKGNIAGVSDGNGHINRHGRDYGTAPYAVSDRGHTVSSGIIRNRGWEAITRQLLTPRMMR